MNITNFEDYSKQLNAKTAVRTINVEEGVKRYSFDGTFKSLYESTKEDKVILLTNNAGDIVGISYDSGADSVIEDNFAGKAFTEAYASKPIMNYLYMIVNLINAGIEPTYINETTSAYGNVYVYSEEENVVTDFENGITKISEEEGIYEERIYSELGFANYIVAKEESAEIEDDEDEDDEEYEDEDDSDEEEEEEELPEEVEIAKIGLGYDASESNIKRYLRDNYGYYLAKGNELDIDEEGNGTVYVGNIRWGRKI